MISAIILEGSLLTLLLEKVIAGLIFIGATPDKPGYPSSAFELCIPGALGQLVFNFSEIDNTWLQRYKKAYKAVSKGFGNGHIKFGKSTPEESELLEEVDKGFKRLSLSLGS